MLRASLPLLLLLTACSTSSTPHVTLPLASPVATGAVPETSLRALLLTAGDLPDLTTRRESASAALTTEAAPQLALCKPVVAVAPHEITSVLAKPPALGQVQVFEVVSVFADAAGARAAYAQAAEAARACPSYDVQGVPYKVEQLSEITVAKADQALHYRLTTPSVISGDVRTLGLRGRYLVLVTGYGAPPKGQDLLVYQAAVTAKALARLG